MLELNCCPHRSIVNLVFCHVIFNYILNIIMKTQSHHSSLSAIKNRATKNNDFHYHLICQFFSVYKTSQNIGKCPLQVFRAQGDIFESLLLSYQNSQKFSYLRSYNHQMFGICGATTIKCLAFVLEKLFKHLIQGFCQCIASPSAHQA